MPPVRFVLFAWVALVLCMIVGRCVMDYFSYWLVGLDDCCGLVVVVVICDLHVCSLRCG